METDKYEELGELDTIQLKFKHFNVIIIMVDENFLNLK